MPRLRTPRTVLLTVAVAAAAAGTLSAAPAVATTAHATATATAGYADCAVLGEGAVGTGVQDVQQAIGTTVDGEFGPQTKTALQAWQKAHHVTVTGVVDAPTWKKLPTALAVAGCGGAVSGSGVTVSCTALGPGDSGPAVGVLKLALGLTGANTFDATMTTALDAAQQKAKLPVTGITSAATWKALHLSGTPACTAGGSTTGDASAQSAVRATTARRVSILLDHTGTTTNATADAAFAYARKQLGKPYKYGATGPSSYDCSGLTMTSYAHAGVTLPRTSATQYTGGGEVVPLSHAEKGDLIFYADDLTQAASIHHVALYAGHGKLLEAPYTGADVRIVSLYTGGLLPVAVRPYARAPEPVVQDMDELRCGSSRTWTTPGLSRRR